MLPKVYNYALKLREVRRELKDKAFLKYMLDEQMKEKDETLTPELKASQQGYLDKVSREVDYLQSKVDKLEKEINK